VMKRANCSVRSERRAAVVSSGCNGGYSSMVRVPLNGRVKLRDVAELGVTLLEHDIEGKSAKTRKVVLKLFADHGYGGGGIVLRAASWFEQDVVHTAH